MLFSNSMYSITLLSILASTLSELRQPLDDLSDERMKEIHELVACFLSQPVVPLTALQLEERLRDILNGLGREVLELTFNQCDPESADAAPHDVTFEAGGYRRVNDKTRNAYVETTFGRITLWRRGYRYWERDSKESNIFPLELILGLVQGATPALAGEIGRMMADNGATQQRVVDQLKRQFGVSLSIDRLRQITESLSTWMEEYRQEYQVAKLLELLQKAYESRGRYKPVFSVGRDGIHMPLAHGGGYQQGAVATIAIYDRRGKRLGTVYLACAPESGQPTLTRELTALITECLQKWCIELGKPLPRLCYVTDAGETESQYYSQVLIWLRHPKGHGKRLHWHRIVDYYHASERITVMAEALFGPGPEASAWSRRMRKVLLERNGASRVLHSAAALKGLRGVQAGRAKDFTLAYNYIRNRTRHMRYAEFKKMRLPIGSGVTEAACKTVFTQRLKLSGMGWNKEGAQVILNLRVILLSGIWGEVYQRVVKSRHPYDLRTYPNETSNSQRIAA